ncbi:PREDICTED: uncharacterized protein LOC104801481 isoform X2 [Tarenaya hassleriana]|uniref:uncharacterized protein LOC104801481 isoform X2 n=1 Tax=Tarenaya hassleriana TaxID=28532 RepID=UPI00053C9903|nr:PREDICTED: uncharacterized protein LOC104801481 isoform X2 [Tarenaya hassleriana]
MKNLNIRENSDTSRKFFDSSFMAHNQVMDSLTSHISLYHSHSISPRTNTNPNPRSAILRWFSSLTLHQRLAHLTSVDPNFVRILVQMLGYVRTKGRGSFIILPDLPSGDLPSICFKKSCGLISRVAESNGSERRIFESTRLFGSREGERVEDCSCSVKFLDSITVSEEFATDVDRFVETMDELSNGGFLRGEESDLGSNWVELEWLKAKGFYSMEAFIANRLEVGLRLAWLNSGSGKRKGMKLKEKLHAAAAAANSYWRKKACTDWWVNLDAVTKRKVWNSVLGKSAKSLICEILREANQASQEEMWIFGFGVGPARQGYSETSAFSVFDMILETTSISKKSSTLASALNGLHVLQELVALLVSCQNGEFPVHSVFFSSMGSLGTLVDCVLRKLRGFLVLISINSAKIELLGENTQKCLPSTSSKQMTNSTHRKKKGKTRNVKRPNAEAAFSKKETLTEEMERRDRDGLEFERDKDTVECKKMSTTSIKHNCCEAISAAKMELIPGLVAGKGRSKKKRKEKNKCTSFKNPEEKNNSDVDSSAIQEVPDNNSSYSSTPQHLQEYINAWSIGEDSHASSVRHACATGTPWSGTVQNQYSKEEVLNTEAERCVVQSSFTVVDPVGGSVREDVNSRDSCHPNGHVEILMSNRRSRTFKECESIGIQDKRKERSHGVACSTSEFVSYEWPAVAPMYFSHLNSHLPTATDRLHLDVGHNLHAYMRQPFVPTMHHGRNPSIEGAHKEVFSRPVPMSLDWPPMVRSNCGVTTPFTCNYDSGVFMDFPEQKNKQELGNDCENNWMLEEDFEMHAVSGVDYNQYFGGGVMYWNPSDHLGTGFSRPPSLSSDDSSWAWHEAEMKRAVDDMVAFSSSYSTNGLASPTAASFCSPFDPLGSGNQPLGYVVPGNEVSGKVLQASPATAEDVGEEDVSGSLAGLSGDVEGNSGDSFSYPILRPIIIPSMSKTEYKRNYDIRSPHVPPSRRDHPRIKRPPSPVVLCVPRAPRPPPPSPVSDSRARRGFPTVRSGSSSPRHWGMRGWLHDGINWEETCGAEVVLPWRNKNLAARPVIQPLPGALLQDHLIAMSQLGRDQEHPDVAFPLQPPEPLNCPMPRASLSLIHSLLNDEIDYFCKQVAAENMARKPYINWAIKRVTRSLQVLWPRSRTHIFGSFATGLSLPSSDVDLVICLPPVRNLEPIKEAGILEGRNGIKETCLQIPIIMLVVEVPWDLISSTASGLSPKDGQICTIVDHDSNGQYEIVGFGDSATNCSQENSGSCTNAKSVRLDISFKTPSHTGLQTTQLVKDLTEQFPAATPLALVLKQFLADRTLDQSYSGGLSSYCLVLLITRFLQHEHHLGRPINQNFGSLLMDFLYFFGNVFDPRQMRVSVQGSGVYRSRERGYSIDPIHIDDPIFPTNNVGRNCFRIHQCIKAFSEAYSILENDLTCLASSTDSCRKPSYKLLSKIIPSMGLL